MSYTSNFLKALQEKGVSTTINAGGTTSPVSLGHRSSGSDSSNYTSNFFTALEKQQRKSISEKAESRVQAMQQKLRGTSRLDTFNNAIRNAGRTTSGGYYSRPSLDTTGEKLYSNVTALEPVLTEKRTALDTAQSSLQQAETDLQTVQDHLDQAKAVYDADPTEENATSYNQIVGAYNLQYQAYSSAFETYSAAYNAYKPYEDEMVKALTAYQLYNNQQQAAFDEWRGTIRDTQTVKADIDQLDGQIQELETEIGNLKTLTGFRNDALGESMKRSLQEALTKLETLRSSRNLLQEEYDWSEYYQYNDLLQAADFAEKSKYVTTANGLEPVLNNLSGMYTETGFDDLTYDYINRNQEARNKAMVNSIGDNRSLLGLDKSYLKKMTDDEISVFNYLYATQGADAAYQYTAYLTGDLTRRQRMEQEAKWATWAEEDPVGSSAFSVLMSPAKGLSYLGQFADLTADGEIDQNAAYNKFSYIPSAIRGEVAQQIEDSGKWGRVGSFAYQTGLSMADFLFATGISGGNSGLAMTIMGSGAAADTTLAARERGVDSGKAFALGTIAGLAEAITEKWSIEALLDPKLLKDGTLKYVLKNMLVEGGEEGASDLINLFCDILIAGDQSEWQQSIDAYVADGKTEREAFLLAFKDQALTVGLDMLGGALSGGILSGGNAAVQGYYNHRLAKQYDLEHVTENDAQEIIDSGLESDHNTESYQLAAKLQKKLKAGTIPTADELSRLLWATEQAIAREEAAEDLPDDTIIGDGQTGTVAGDVTDPSGPRLPSVENDTQAPGFVTQNAQNGTQTQVNDTALPAGVPLSIADQLRQEQAQNGGTQYERTYERAAGPATAQPAGELYLPGGAGISDGSAERNASAGTAEQAGVLASSPEQRRSAWTDRSRATVARQNYARSLRLEKVSSLDLGLQNGTEARNIQVMPQESWDAEMSQLADRIYNETGKGVTYVMGRIQIRGTGGTVGYARGVITSDRIIVQADHLRIPMEQIADHEAYHAKVDFAAENRLDLNAEIKRHILATFSAEQFQQVLDKYIVGLRGVIDVSEARTGEEFEAAVRQIEEEIFADAYAGINAFGANANQFTDSVNEKMDQLYMGKIRNQDNGTEEPTGPPSDRYSYAGENANNADLDALARAKEMQAAGVADETIRQQTGWHTGMDGKWRWEIDDSTMRYDSSGDLRGAESAKWAMEDYESARDDLWGNADMDTLEKVRAYNRADIAGDDTTKQELYDELINGQYAYYFDQYVEAMARAKGARNAPAGGTLQDYIDHPALFEAYPQLRKIRLRFADLPEGTRGQYDPEQDVITLSESLRGKPQDTLIHEVQHVIQKSEGFAGGASVEYWKQQRADIVETIAGARRNLDMWLDDIGYKEAQRESLLAASRREKTMEQHWKDMAEFKANSKYARQIAACEAELAEFQRQYDEITHSMTAYEQYENTAGEIEARDAAARRSLTPEQRRNTAPARADDRTVFVEDVDEMALAEMDAEYGPQMQSYFDPDISDEEIGSNIQAVAQMDPVVRITGEEFAKGEKDLITQVEEFFGQLGNFAHNEQLGDVVLDRRGIKSDIAHGIGRKKAAAFAAVPDVISQGMIVDYQQNWKDRGYDTAVVAAPITIGTEDHIAAVILTRSNQTNRFYVHEVLTTKNGAMPFKTGTQKKGAPGGDAPSVFSILDKIRAVKNQTEMNEHHFADGRASVENGDELGLRLGARYSVDDVDSHGHSLTPEQQSFYAQSQARDSSGRLLVLYHQTDGDFTIFDTRHPGAGSRDSDTPFGIFLKQTAGDIGLAGKKQMALYANITNPLRAANREDLARQLREISGSYAAISDKHKQLDAQYHEKFEQAKKAWRDYIIEWRAANPGANRSALNDDPKFNELFDAEDTVVDEWTAAADLLSTQAKEAITQDLRAAGYDGVFLENDVGSWGRRTDAIIALDPQQVKNISNKTPTSNPDIRYSVDDGGQDPAQQQPAAAPKKIRPVAESRPLIAKKDLRNTVLNLFSIPNGQRAEVGAMIDSYADRLIKNGSLTEDDRKAFFDRMYDAGVMVMPAEEYSAFARSHIVDGRIYVSDSVKSDFGDDWADIRRRAFAAGVYLVNDRSASGIDQWNATLSAEDMLPGLFDSEETDERTILERILQVAEEGKDEHLSLAEYTRRLSQQEGISEDEFLDNMERQLDWALRTFAEKARLEVHLRDRTGRKIAQEREKGAERMTRQQAKEAQRRADERQARKDSARRAKERRELRELQQRTLKQLQWLSRNRNRAPEELQATWDEVLGDIDLYAISAADEMRWSDKYNATWQDIVTMYDKAKEEDPNFFESKELEWMATRLRGKKIGDLDIDALNDLYRLAVGLRTAYYNRNNVLADEQYRLFAEVYSDSVQEFRKAPGGNQWDPETGQYRVTQQRGSKVREFFDLDQLTPMNVMQRMAGWDPDGAFYSMAKQLERGERDMRAYTVKAQKMLQDFLTEHEDWVRIADGQGKDAIWYEAEIPELLALEIGKKPEFGKTIKVYMTPAQKIHMYLESRNQDNLRHMSGGRTFVNKELYSQGKRQQAFVNGTTVAMAPETVRAIVSDLTPIEMELAVILDRYYNSFAAKEINRVSNILYGYDKAMGKFYVPVYTDKSYTKKSIGIYEQTAESQGNLKSRIKGSKTPSYNISAFEAFEKSVEQNALFCGMAIPARNVERFLNWGSGHGNMSSEIARKWGKEAETYVTNLVATLQSGNVYKSDTISSGLSKLQSNYITAIFGANPSIVLKQLGSIPLAGAYLDARNVPTPAQIAQIDRSLISKYTQELEWRTMGYSTPETKQLKDNPNWTQTNKVIKFAFGGGAITAMDGWAASTLWPWAENKVRREHPELAVGTKAQVEAGESAFYKKVAEEFEIAVSRSQSVSDEIHQGTLRKSKNPITKAFTMFRSDSAQTYNALRQKIGEARYYMRTGAKDKVIQTAKKAAGTAFVAMLINAAWSEAVSFLMALWKNKGKYYRDDEDELTFQSVAGEMVSNMLGSFAGVVTGGEELFEFIGNIITGDKWYGIETPGMEQLNSIMDIVYESGSGMRDLVAGGWDILKNGGDLGDYFGKHSGQILGSIKDLAEAATMYLPGLPASNLEAYLVGALKWLSPELGTAYDDMFSNVGKDDLSKLDGDALVSRVSSIMEDRGMGDNEDVARIIAGLYETGHKTAVPSDIPTSVSVDGENQKLSAYQQQIYDTVWKETVSTYLEDMVTSDHFMEADEKSQAKMLDKLYDYATVRAKTQLFDTYEVSDAAARISAMKANGVAPSDYIVWNVTTSGLKTLEKMTILQDWDMSEEAKKAIVGTIIGTDLETEKGNPSQYAKFLSALEEGMTADQYLSMRTDGVDVEDYLEATESGLDSDDALNLATAKSELEPIGDEEDVSDLQRWRASVDFTDDVEDQLTALSMVMDDYELINVEIANGFGVAPDVYVRFYEIRSQYDADGSGSYKQVEIQAAIDAQFGYLSQQQKAALWQLMNGSTKSAKKNPYSKEVGQQILDAKAAAKEAAAQKQTETPDDSTDDDSFSQELLNQLLGRG